MFGMYKGARGIHLWLCLTAKDETSPSSISKQSTWICFTVCVVVTSDMMSLSLEI